MTMPIFNAWRDLVRVLENMEVHHGRIKHYSKQEMFVLMESLYAIAVEAAYDTAKSV